MYWTEKREERAVKENKELCQINYVYYINGILAHHIIIIIDFHLN